MFLAGFSPADSDDEEAKPNNTEALWGDTKQSSVTKAPTKARERGQTKKGHI